MLIGADFWRGVDFRRQGRQPQVPVRGVPEEREEGGQARGQARRQEREEGGRRRAGASRGRGGAQEARTQAGRQGTNQASPLLSSALVGPALVVYITERTPLPHGRFAVVGIPSRRTKPEHARPWRRCLLKLVPSSPSHSSPRLAGARIPTCAPSLTSAGPVASTPQVRVPSPYKCGS
eukprot:3094406-Pyramimonas_sp.AAC.2